MSLFALPRASQLDAPSEHPGGRMAAGLVPPSKNAERRECTGDSPLAIAFCFCVDESNATGPTGTIPCSVKKPPGSCTTRGPWCTATHPDSRPTRCPFFHSTSSNSATACRLSPGVHTSPRSRSCRSRWPRAWGAPIDEPKDELPEDESESSDGDRCGAPAAARLERRTSRCKDSFAKADADASASIAARGALGCSRYSTCTCAPSRSFIELESKSTRMGSHSSLSMVSAAVSVNERIVARTHGIVTARTHFWIIRTVKTSRPHGEPIASSTGRSYLVGPDAMSERATSHAPIGEARRGIRRGCASSRRKTVLLSADRLAAYSKDAPDPHRGDTGSSSPGAVSKHTGRRAVAASSPVCHEPAACAEDKYGAGRCTPSLYTGS
eukprot:scaffold12229_cov32-Tisochrysis_lutea.AAC.7